MAEQEAAPHRLSSESTAPAPQRGTRRALTSRMRRRRALFPPQHAHPKQMDDASTLAKDLLGVSLVPETTMQSATDATSSPSVDREVPSVSHPVPFRFSFDPPSDPASLDAFIKACPNPPGYHMRSTWD
jgi:hypothetical protein